VVEALGFLRTTARTALVTVCLLTTACYSDRVAQIHASEFVNYGEDPLSHTVYEGSDAQYHYFGWSHGKSGGRWKIPKSEMPFEHEFPVGSRHAFVERDALGHWQPHLPQ